MTERIGFYERVLRKLVDEGLVGATGACSSLRAAPSIARRSRRAGSRT